jgi:hypothetical protein
MGKAAWFSSRRIMWRVRTGEASEPTKGASGGTPRTVPAVLRSAEILRRKGGKVLKRPLSPESELA